MVQALYVAHDIQEEVQQPLAVNLLLTSCQLCGWAAAIADDGRRQSLRE
jgi:hypothetical protein